MSDKRWAIFKPDGRVICFHPTQDAAEDAIGVCWQLGIEGCTVRHCRVGDTDEAYARGWRDALAAAVGRMRENRDWHRTAANENRPAEHLAASDAFGIAAEAIAALTPPW